MPSLWNFASDLDERLAQEIERLALRPDGYVYHPLCHMLGTMHPPCIRCNVSASTRFFRDTPGRCRREDGHAAASAGSAAVVQAEVGSVWKIRPSFDRPGMVGVTLYATDVLLTPAAHSPPAPSRPEDSSAPEDWDWSDIA